MAQLEKQHSTFCPICDHPLTRNVEGEVGNLVEWKNCGFCGAKLGPPWPEHQWSEPSSEPTPSYAVLQHRASCLFCEGPLMRIVEGDPGKRVEWKACVFCGAKLGPPWLEHQWSEPSSEPIPCYAVNPTGTGQVFQKYPTTRAVGDLV